MQRVVALDIGSVRIGVAVSDPLGTFAQGVGVLKAENDWISELAKIVDQYDNPLILLGFPRRTDGSEGPEIENIRAAAERIKEHFTGLTVEFWDERFTTTIAQQALIEADVSRRDRKKSVDKVAATLLLQSYLDRRRNV